jgi:hypothetical protein
VIRYELEALHTQLRRARQEVHPSNVYISVVAGDICLQLQEFERAGRIVFQCVSVDTPAKGLRERYDFIVKRTQDSATRVIIYPRTDHLWLQSEVDAGVVPLPLDAETFWTTLDTLLA